MITDLGGWRVSAAFSPLLRDDRLSGSPNSARTIRKDAMLPHRPVRLGWGSLHRIRGHGTAFSANSLHVALPIRTRGTLTCCDAWHSTSEVFDLKPTRRVPPEASLWGFMVA